MCVSVQHDESCTLNLSLSYGTCALVLFFSLGKAALGPVGKALVDITIVVSQIGELMFSLQPLQ